MLRKVLGYGIVLGIALVGIKLLEYSYFYKDIALEIYLGIIAVGFLGLGVFVGMQRYETEPANQHIPSLKGDQHREDIDQAMLEEIGLSKREQEVLSYLAKGYSNQEIADKLFVSLNTIKTHTARLYSKLDVKRRTQAISKAKELNILQQ